MKVADFLCLHQGKGICMNQSQNIRIMIEEGATYPEHFHQEVELVYVLDGSIDLILTGEKYRLRKDDIILINSKKKHAWNSVNESLLCRVFMDYSIFTDMVGRKNINFWCNSQINNDRDHELLRELLHRLVRLYSAQNGNDSFELRSLEYELLDRLQNDFLLKGEASWSGSGDERIDQAVQYISENYDRVITLGEVSSMVFMSESSFSRLFKKIKGSNFIEYINSVRLQKATESLLYTNQSITDIAVECGFSNPSAFNKLFKKVYDCSPTQYKNKMQSDDLTGTRRKRNGKAEKKLEQLLRKDSDSVSYSSDRKENIIAVPEIEIGINNREGLFGINMGIGADLLQARLREHLKVEHDQIGFSYVRLDNIFHESMYIQLKRTTRHYVFDQVDNVLDYILELGMIPVIDLSKKAKKAYQDVGHNIFSQWDEDNIMLPELREWESLLKAFIKHILIRYDAKRVLNWRFEYSDRSYQEQIFKQDDNGEDRRYLQLWKSSYHIIKNALPDAVIGGDGFILDSDYDVFNMHLQFWQDNACMPDYFSVNAYPFAGYSAEKDVYATREIDLKPIPLKLDAFRKNLQFHGIDDRPITVNEWNTSMSERNYYNDSCAKAAHVLQQLIAFTGSGITGVYNHGSDSLSQYFDSTSPLIGALGLVTRDGIPKPAFFSFLFINKLYRTVLDKGPNYIVTTNDKGSYYIAVCNAKAFNHSYCLKKESEIEIDDLVNIFEDNDELTMTFKLNAADGENYRIKRHLLGEESGSLLREWEHMNRIEDLGIGDINYLINVCRPRYYCTYQKADENGLDIKVNLKPHEIMLLHIYKHYE